MELVQAFNLELSSLYDVKPPISKAKMSQITRVAIKGIKMYKHIVQSVERFIAKCRPEYKIPGLYVIDSIIRQSRHQFTPEKDVFGPRFVRNLQSTFQNLFLTCQTEDKPKIVRVMNLWQRNNVFSAETIQPLLDMANPKANLGQIKVEISPQINVNESSSGPSKCDPDANLVMHLQQLATTLGLVKNTNNGTNSSVGGSEVTASNNIQSVQQNVRFNKKLLDFDYGEEDEEEDRGETPTEAEPPAGASLNNSDEANANPLALSMAQNLLSNPELLQRLQQMQQTIQQHQQDSNSQVNLDVGPVSTSSSFISSFQPLDSLQINSDEISGNVHNIAAQQYTALQNLQLEPQFTDRHYPGLTNVNSENSNNFNASGDQFVPSRAHSSNKREYGFSESNRDHKSQSPRSKGRRLGRSREGFRDKDERQRRSRSPRNHDRDKRTHRSDRSPKTRNDRHERDRSLSPVSKEREKDRERRRKGLPAIKKGYLTICSTTLWLGHVPKLVSEADISDSFGEFGTINSIDLIPPRGCAYVCMNRRQDAYKALNQLRNIKLHGSIIKMAWAPGKGMKGKEFKDYWDVDLGASYIPFEKLHDTIDLDLLEDGGMIDEETIPEKLLEIREKKMKEIEDRSMEETLKAKALMQMNLVQIQGVGDNSSSFGVNLPSGILIPPLSNMQHGQFSGQMDGSQNIPLKSPPLPPAILTNPNAVLNSAPVIKDNTIRIEEMITNSANSSQSISHYLGIPPNPSSGAHMNSQMHHNQNAIFQPPLLNIPPPSVLSGQRPPPLPWLAGNSGMGSAANVGPRMGQPFESPNRTSNEKGLSQYEDKRNAGYNSEGGIGHRLHSENDESPGSRIGNQVGGDRNHERFGGHARMAMNDDPFAPSVYELKAMERNTGIRPPLIPVTPRAPMARGYEDMSSREQYPRNENPGRRFNREWRQHTPSNILPPFDELPVRGPVARGSGPPHREWGRQEQHRQRGNRNERFSPHGGGGGFMGNRGGRDRGDRDRNRGERERPWRDRASRFDTPTSDYRENLNDRREDNNSFVQWNEQNSERPDTSAMDEQNEPLRNEEWNAKSPTNFRGVSDDRMEAAPDSTIESATDMDSEKRCLDESGNVDNSHETETLPAPITNCEMIAPNIKQEDESNIT